MIKVISFIGFLLVYTAAKGQFAPAVGQIGTTAISKDSSLVVNWANALINFNPGPENISDPQSPLASFGIANNALGEAEGNSYDVVSLGDGGIITLGFQYPIIDGNGPDFAVFENSFTNTYLEFAFVEVSTNGIDFVRFPAISNIQNTNQTGGFGDSDPTLVNNLAGKYRQGFGTPFDLNDLIDSVTLNLDSINYIRIVDVVGSIDTSYSSFDHNGTIINDPFPSPFNSSGFDLDAIAVINQNNPLSVSADFPAQIAIYPNPVVNSFIIKAKNMDALVKIYNLQGQLVKVSRTNSLIDAKSLANGTYIVTVYDGLRIETCRLAVAH